MSYFSDSRIFYVNSRNRVSGSNTDFSYAFNIDPQSKFNHVVLLDISVPKSFYAIQSTQTFVLNENGTQSTITINSGNYTRQSFASTLQTALNTAGNWTYDISYKVINRTYDDGKLTFTVTGNGGVQPQFIFNGIDSLFEEMGFDSTSTNTFSANSLTSTNVINLATENTLFLRSDICQDDNNILQNIVTTSDSAFSVINFVNPNPHEYSKIFVPNKTVYHFRLTNEDDNLIDTNGQNIVFTLMLYTYNNVSDVIKRFILLKTLDTNN